MTEKEQQQQMIGVPLQALRRLTGNAKISRFELMSAQNPHDLMTQVADRMFANLAGELRKLFDQFIAAHRDTEGTHLSVDMIFIDPAFVAATAAREHADAAKAKADAEGAAGAASEAGRPPGVQTH